MKYFNVNAEYELLINTFFLCGCKYNKNSQEDKRNELKKYIESKSEKKCRAIILEEFFAFIENKNKRKNNTLYYNDINLLNLTQVELLASLYANKIYLLHETISTAAELGLFAGYPILQERICLIIPAQRKKAVMSTFINLAFFHRPNSLLVDPIEFEAMIEGEKTYFKDSVFDNSVSDEFRIKIDSNIINTDNPSYNGIKKRPFNKITNDMHNVEYIVTDKLEFYIGIDALKIQLLSMFVDSEFKIELRKSKRLIDHINYLKKNYSTLLYNAYVSNHGEINAKRRFVIKGLEKCTIEQAIGFFIYWLKAIELIDLQFDGDNIKLTLKCELLHLDKEGLSSIIFNKDTLGGL